MTPSKFIRKTALDIFGLESADKIVVSEYKLDAYGGGTR